MHPCISIPCNKKNTHYTHSGPFFLQMSGLDPLCNALWSIFEKVSCHLHPASPTTGLASTQVWFHIMHPCISVRCDQKNTQWSVFFKSMSDLDSLCNALWSIFEKVSCPLHPASPTTGLANTQVWFHIMHSCISIQCNKKKYTLHSGPFFSSNVRPWPNMQCFVKHLRERIRSPPSSLPYNWNSSEPRYDSNLCFHVFHTMQPEYFTVVRFFKN